MILLLIGGILLYNFLANKYLIFDNPNERSSHIRPTIRGGGVVFLLSILLTGVFYHPIYWVPITGAVAIGVISFLDDNLNLSQRLRLVVHVIAITLLFTFLSVFTQLPVWGVVALYILTIGIVNAYNFMDGINGITGLYSLIVLGGLQYVNIFQSRFTEPDLIWFPMLACVVFLYFNFRRKAKVFAGDVGSITMAFWIVFLMLDLIFQSGNIKYILFLSLYGVDTILTILHRIKLKQNILLPHRLHFYQILANEQKIPHLLVSAIYGVLQTGIIFFVILSDVNLLAMSIIVLLPLAALYLVLKPYLTAQPVTLGTRQQTFQTTKSERVG